MSKISNISILNWVSIIGMMTIVTTSWSMQTPILECRDANGKKLFASICPKGTTQTRELEILSPPTETKAVKELNARAKKNLLDRDANFKARETQKSENEANERDNQRALANKCYEDRKKLTAISIGGPYEIGKESDGTPIYLDDNKRSELISELSERLKKCNVE